MRVALCLRCGKPVYDGVCRYCGYDLQYDKDENWPPDLSRLTRVAERLFPNRNGLGAALLFFVLILGSVLWGIVTYGIGGDREYYYYDYYSVDTSGVRSMNMVGHSYGAPEERTFDHFLFGFVTGMMLLAPIVLSLAWKIKREFAEQRKLERKHPIHVWIILHSIIVCAIIITTMHSHWSDENYEDWYEMLFITTLIFYIGIFPSFGAFGALIAFEGHELIPYSIAMIASTYAIYGAWAYGYWHRRNCQLELVRDFIEHSPPGCEMPISEIAWVLMMEPVMVKAQARKLIRKGQVDCRVEHWRLIIGEDQERAGSLAGPTLISSLGAMAVGTLSGEEVFRQHQQVTGSVLSGIADQCSRCGNPLHGEVHCPLCGYRSLNSYYDTMSINLPPLTSWISGLRHGIDPLKNAFIVFLAACASLGLIVGGISGLEILLSGGYYSHPRLYILLGMGGGALLGLHMFLPHYLKIRRELIEQRPLSSKEPITLVTFTNYLTGILIVFGALVWFINNGNSDGTGLALLFSILFMYTSIITGGLLAILLVVESIQQSDDMFWFYVVQLSATCAFYTGMVFAAIRRKKILSKYGQKGFGKRKKGMILEFLSEFMVGDEVPLPVIGRVVRMEPDPVRTLLGRMLKRGEILGHLSDYHLQFDDVPHKY